MIEKPNKTRLRNGLIAVLLAITLIAPAVFQGSGPGGFQANAHKTGDYKSDCYQKLCNGYLEEVQVCHFLPDLLQTGRCEEVDHAGNYQQ